MSDDKVVRQNTGFVRAELKRSREHEARAGTLEAAGNTTGAKALRTRARNERNRAEKAANTIADRLGIK